MPRNRQRPSPGLTTLCDVRATIAIANVNPLQWILYSGRLSRRETGFGFRISTIHFTENIHFKISTLAVAKRVYLFETETIFFSFFTLTVVVKWIIEIIIEPSFSLRKTPLMNPTTRMVSAIWLLMPINSIGTCNYIALNLRPDNFVAPYVWFLHEEES